VRYAQRLRDLTERYRLWSAEPALIRAVLDVTEC
jgi:hypothetical protein